VSRFRRLFRLTPRTDAAVLAEFDEELDTLIAARVESLVARGMSYDDARAEATRRLGDDLDTVRQRLHHSVHRRERRMRLDEQLDNFVHDLRYAARGLMRRPAFTTIAVLTLAIGIGATTAIFSAVNTLLLRRLPYAAPEQLMAVSLTTPPSGTRAGREDMVWSYPKFLIFRDAQKIFSDLSLYSLQQFTATSGEVELLRGEFVGATYLSTLGLTTSRGRDFDRAVDAHPGAERQAIISHALWERRFNADPNIIGKTIDLDRAPYNIVGVGPADFKGLTGQAELFVPVTTRPADDLGQMRSHEFYLVARRNPAVDEGAAIAGVKVLGKTVYDATDDRRSGNDGKWGAGARPLDAVRVAPLVRRSLFILFSAVGFVLLIACVNVANLLLGRASTRRRELAVRVALGAGRARLVRLLMTESLLLAIVGGVASLGVAWAGTRALSTIDPAAALRVPRFDGVGSVTFSLVRLDWTALGFAFAVTLAVGVLFGLIPVLDAARAPLAGSMRDAGDKHGSAPISRRALVVVEVALAMILLAGSGLMLRSLTKLLAIDTGFDARGVLTARLRIPPGALARDSMPEFYDDAIRRLRALPGVTNVAIANCAPLSGGCNNTRMSLLDQGPLDFERPLSGGIHWTSPAWFETMRVPVKRGRVFTDADRLGAPKVVVINETAARTFWPNGDALGKRIAIDQGGFNTGAEVIGVVGDVRQNVDSAASPDVYASYLQSPRPGLMLFIRTAGNPAALGADVRRVLHDVAPRFPMYDMKPMAERAAAATAQARFSAVLLGLFAATALSLAVIGIYGVMSLAVTARTRELGIRIALGADQRRVRRLVVNEGIALVGVGAMIGLVGARLSTRVLQNLLFDLQPSDPVTYVGILILLGGAAVLASWIPARRASKVDPMVALRAE
jgi:predicted permease